MDQRVRRKPIISDVARFAGISTATVTRVLRETNLKGAEDATQEARA